MTELTPREIVRELDRFIIGQDDAKRAVAVALRNRYRRAQLPEDIREEVTPKNILMIGPTGVGKTEIARRLAKLVEADVCTVELALDEGTLLGGGKALPLAEVEVELKAGSEAAAVAFAQALAAEFGLTPEPKSKVQRALALADLQ